jgi:hypothetical protein
MHLRWRAPNSKDYLTLEIIGVVRDFRADAEAVPTLAVYIPYWIWPPWNPTLVVRTAADPSGIASGVQKLVRSTDPLIAIAPAETLRRLLDTAVASRRFLT